MPDTQRTTEKVPPAEPPLAADSEEEAPQQGLYERAVGWVAGLPWWAMILAVVAVVVLYSMFTSVTYQRIIKFLADDPQTSTDDLFEVVQVVGKPEAVVGTYVGETQDSIQTFINQLLTHAIDSELVTRAGFILQEDPATLTIKTEDGGTLTIPKDQIASEERTQTADGTQVTLTYVDRVTVTGVMTKRDNKTMTIRTVDEEQTTVPVDRILSRESETVPCDKEANPNCQDREVVTLQRQGEVVSGRLTALSQTNLTLQLPDNTTREFRRGEVDSIFVPTLTVALNQETADQFVLPGDEVRIAFVEGTDITGALEQLGSLDEIPVPLRYADGEARAVLVSYPDVNAALEATGAGDVRAFLYLDDGPDRLAAAQWVEDHPDAGVVLAGAPRECARNCEASVKLPDDTVQGTVLAEDANSVTVRTVEPEYVVIQRDQIIQNKSMKPGECALNNLRGCNAGIFLTLRVTFAAYGIALLIGLFVGLMRVSNNPALYAASTLYVEVIRGIPLLVILLYAGFVVSPWLRDHTFLKLNDQSEAIIGLAFGYGAFVAEIFRAGIQSISRGQMEAARSLGMSYPQAMRTVVLPQAVRVVLPPLGNDFIAMLKDSALISVLALPDLLQLGRLYISRTFRAFEGYNTVAILYLLMTLFLSMMVRVIERRSRLPR